MLKQSASSVLASLPRTVKRETRVNRGAVALFGKRRVPGWRVCLGRLRAGGWNIRRGRAGKKSELFEHPDQLYPSCFIPDLSAIEMLQW